MGGGGGGGGGGGECGGLRKKGLWSEKEDKILREYINEYGEGKWNRISKLTGLKRSGKSCRLRWMNYLSPTVKKDDFSHQEEDLIIRLHKLLGNRWSLIAGRIPGRTDNQVKNHWNTHLSKKLAPKRKGCKKEKISCIPLSSSSSELECTKEMDNINHCPSNPSSNFPFYEDNGELIDRPITMEEDGSSWSPMFGTNTTVQELDQMMMSEYSNLNYNTLSSVDQVYPLDVLWDGLWSSIDQEWSHI